MQKPKFTFVKQEQEAGCAIACIAMILGKSYWDIEKSFLNDFSKQGIVIQNVIDYLSANGVTVIRKGHYGYNDREDNNKRMIKPFADIHYISFQQFVDVDNNHALVMTKNGKLICPTKKYEADKINCYQIDDILGCFYDKKEKNGHKNNSVRRPSRRRKDNRTKKG